MDLRTQSFCSAEEFLRAYSGYRPACLLTDHRMLGMTGVELLEQLRRGGVSLSVVVVTAFADTELTVRAIRSGAVTLLEKPYSRESLSNAIEQALEEDRDKHADETRLLQIRERLNSLTDSERDVLKLIIQGQPNKVTARTLNLSVRTVESRRSSIFEKMGVGSVAEVVQLVMIGCPELH